MDSFNQVGKRSSLSERKGLTELRVIRATAGLASHVVSYRFVRTNHEKSK